MPIALIRGDSPVMSTALKERHLAFLYDSGLVTLALGYKPTHFILEELVKF